jgi:hypothetical protein
MSHTASSNLKPDLNGLYELYYSYYLLFGNTSSEIQELLKQKLLKEKETQEEIQKDAEIAQEEAEKEAHQKRLETSKLFKKIANLFIYHTDLGLYGLTISAKISSSTGAMAPYQTHDSQETMATLNCVVASVSLALNYQKIKEQNKILLENGIITPSELSEKKIFQEALNRSKTALIMSIIGAVATALSLLPDPTFATKIIAAAFFIGMNLYSSYFELKSAHQTLSMIQIIRALKQDDNSQNSLTTLNYQTFSEEMVRKNEQSSDSPENSKKLMEMLLLIGQQLKRSDLDFDTTELTQKEWLELAEKTLIFKRKTHFLNTFRSVISGMVSGFIMGIGAALLLKNIQSLMDIISLPSVVASVVLTFSKLFQNFTLNAFFKRTVLQKSAFSEKLKFSLPVLSDEQIKMLESNSMQLKLKQYQTRHGIDLFKTLKAIKTIKTGDDTFKNSRNLRTLIAELNNAERRSDTLRIDLLVQIGREIQTIFPLAKAVKSNSPQTSAASAFLKVKQEKSAKNLAINSEEEGLLKAS